MGALIEKSMRVDRILFVTELELGPIDHALTIIRFSRRGGQKFIHKFLTRVGC